MISTRLKTVADLLGTCDRVIDIGCDHGYLGVYLLENKLVQHVSFVDMSTVSVMLAKKNAEHHLANWQSCTDFSVSDGFNSLNQATSYDTLVISGLGAIKIIKIIANMKNKINFGIFGPQSDAPLLRHFFNERNIKIVDEQIVCERDFFYELIKVDFNQKPLQKYSEFEELIGPILCKKKNKILYQYWSEKLNFFQTLPTQRYDKIIGLIKQFLEQK